MGTVTQMPVFGVVMGMGLAAGHLPVEASRPHPSTLERPRVPIIRACPPPKPVEHTLDDRHFEDPERWDGMS